MCDDTCRGGENHRAECEMLRHAGVRVSVDDLDDVDTQYSAVSVIRLLLLQERELRAETCDSNTDQEDYLLCLSESLMDHNQDR